MYVKACRTYMFIIIIMHNNNASLTNINPLDTCIQRTNYEIMRRNVNPYACKVSPPICRQLKQLYLWYVTQFEADRHFVSWPGVHEVAHEKDQLEYLGKLSALLDLFESSICRHNFLWTENRVRERCTKVIIHLNIGETDNARTHNQWTCVKDLLKVKVPTR